MHRLAIICVLAACGRVDFDDRSDGASSPSDAAAPCMPLQAGETVQQCAAAFASPDTAPDQLVFDCAMSCEWGACIVVVGCPTCACPYYAKSQRDCDPMTGMCGPPINGNGCLGLGLETGPPWNCITTGVTAEGACMVRGYQRLGAC